MRENTPAMDTLDRLIGPGHALGVYGDITRYDLVVMADLLADHGILTPDGVIEEAYDGLREYQEMLRETEEGWYAIVWAGAGAVDMPSRGPFPSRDAAGKEMSAWRKRTERAGENAGRYIDAYNMRVQGPYSTEEAAADADISRAPGEVE